MSEQEREAAAAAPEVEAHIKGRKAQDEAPDEERESRPEDEGPDVEGHIRPKLGS
jgi:hypothetical protein